MKGIVRKLDDLGRITIPMEYRRQLGYEDKQGIDLYIVGNVIHLEKGVGRCLDELGRYTLSIEVRRRLRIDNREYVDMWIEDDGIRIKKAALQCVFCGYEDEKQLMEVEGILICRSCGSKVADKFMEE